ncbi:MAG: ABC-three component system protein [Anaerostipes hadrus]
MEIKIVWPYSNKSILKQTVWEEWLLYLIIRCIESRDNVKNEGFYVIKNKEKNRKVKVLYATNHTKLPDFLKDYLDKAYQDISPGQIMIIKTDTTPASKRISSIKMSKIVSDISNAISIDNHVYIDSVENSIRQMSIIHISALVDEMINFVEQEENEGLRGKALEKKLGERIVEVLYGI